MTEQVFNTDICIIGAGPAGTAIAKRLASFGYTAVIIEKSAFPRSHVGICLSDTTDNLLDYLEVGEAIKRANFLTRKTTVVRWDTDAPVLTDQPGFHVDRGTFDQILLDNARSVGVHAIQPAHVTNIHHNSNGGWKINLTLNTGHQVVNSNFLVDASGKSNALSGKTARCGPPLFALHAIWKLKSNPDYDGFMEAGENAWLWMAQLKGHRAMVSLYTEPKHFSQSMSQNIKGHYYKMLEQFELLNHCELGEVIDEVKGCDASSRYSTEPIGQDFIKVGDANLSVDPMASQGVHLALTSGIQAAIVVNTLLRYPEYSAAALEFYRSRQKERIQQYTEKTASAYAQVAARRPEAFWHVRAKGAPAPQSQSVLKPLAPSNGNQAIKLSPYAKLLDTPVLKSEYVAPEPALYHPNLDRPVAFLGGKNLASLLQLIYPGQTVNSLLASWIPQVSNQLGSEILNWLWEREVLVPYSTSS